MLDYVIIDGQRASIGENARAFPEYFEIDSMSLMLGKNGAGKTRLLQSVAEVLTVGSPLGDQGHWQVRNRRNRSGEDLFTRGDIKTPPPDVGVIYFTPLPYQRAMPSHRRFVNASRLRSSTLKESMLINFANVAQSLGVSTELTASLSYHPSIFERLIVPTLLEMQGRILDPRLNEEMKSYAAARANGEPFGMDSRAKIFARKLRAWMEQELDHRRGELYRIAAFATLEDFGKELNHRLHATTSILSTLELVRFEASDFDPQFNLHTADRFQQALFSTLSIASKSDLLPIRHSNATVGMQFIVDRVERLQDVENSRSSFKLSWANLSSGLLSLVDQFARLDVALARLSSRSVNSVLVLIDEGDSYLHLDWQRQYVEKLDQFLASAKKRYGFEVVQAIVATHSPIISGDFPSPLIQRLGDEMVQGVKTFGSSLDALVLDTFGTPSIGSKAAHQVQRLHKAVLARTLTQADLILINEIGDERLKRAVLAEPRDGE